MTTICNFIKFYQHEVWHYLSDVFRLNLKAAELGFTDDLIFRITDFYKGQPANCEVYVVSAEDEVTRGADLELFIFNGSLYDHYMLQAKVMNFSGVYKDIAPFDGNAQFCKLIKAANAENAFPLYLLYSGKTKGSNLGSCIYGYAIIWAKKIKDFRLEQKRKLDEINKKNSTTKKNIPKIRFNDLIVDLKPIHYLFCPNSSTNFELPSGKTYDEIYKEYPYINISDLTGTEVELDIPETQRGNFNQSGAIPNRPKYLAPIRIIINDESIYNSQIRLET